jgi:multiple sugar transport system substrate-binding protein
LSDEPHIVFEKLMRTPVDRRTFIQRLAAAGAATPAVAAFLAACGGDGNGGEGGGAASPGGAFNFTEIGPLPQGEAASRPLQFDAFEFKPELVREFLATFGSQYNEKVNLSILPGDYAAVMVNKFVSGAPVDFLYTQDQVVKFYTAGWVEDLSGLWNVEEIKSATLPVQWEVQTYNGALLGLPYFNSAKGVVATNELLRSQANLTSYPRTHSELYEEVRELKRQGVADFPIIMHWAPAFYGITQMWVGEALCRGDSLWADDLSATFDSSTAAAEVLEDWRMLYQDDLVRPANLTWQDSDRLDAFGTGSYVYAVINGYNLYDLNNPEQSNIAGNVRAIPYSDEPWGFLDYGLYSVGKKDPGNETDERVLQRLGQLVNFMGYKDQDGDYRVAREWMKIAFLGPGYPELWDDPEVIQSFEEWMPDIAIKDEFRTHYDQAVPITGWKAVWYPDFNSAAQTILASAVSGEQSVSDAVQTLRTTWDDLQTTYA